MKRTLKYGKNFRITMNIIEHSNRIYSTYNEREFFGLIKSKSDELSNDVEMSEMGGMGTGFASLPVWNSAYPKIMINGTEFQLKSGNTFSDEEWTDDTEGIRGKHEVMNDDSFEKGTEVILQGLEGKKEWNGLAGKIAGHYNFDRERFPVHIGGNVNKTVLIKSCNLQQR